MPRTSDSAMISGHGTLDPAAPMTTVPAGVNLVFHADATEGLSSMAALRLLEIKPPGGFDEYVGQYDYPVEVPNYTLTTLDDWQRATDVAVVSDKGYPVLWVGDQIPSGTPMCTGDESTCDHQGGHACQGILGTVAKEFSVIHFCVCRVVVGSKSHRTQLLTADDPDPDATYRRAEDMAYMCELVKTPGQEQTAEEYWSSADLTDVDRAFLLTSRDISNWWEVKCAASVFGDLGRFGLFNYTLVQSENVSNLVYSDPALRPELDAAMAVLQALTSEEKPSPESFALVDELDERDLDQLCRVSDRTAQICRYVLAEAEPGAAVVLDSTRPSAERDDALDALQPRAEARVRAVLRADDARRRWLALRDVRRKIRQGRDFSAYADLLQLSSPVQEAAQHDDVVAGSISRVLQVLTDWAHVHRAGAPDVADAWLEALWSRLDAEERTSVRTLQPDIVDDWRRRRSLA